MADKKTYHTVILKKNRLVDYYDEYLCGATAVMPGFFLQVDASATVDGANNQTIKPNDTAYGGGAVIVAIENALIGDSTVTTDGGTIDDAYAEGDLVRAQRLQLGDEVYPFLKANAGTATEGSLLAFSNDGKLVLDTGGSGGHQFEALWTVPSGTGDQRIGVRFVK